MKFNPTWTQIALLVVLLGAVVLTNLFAPGVIGVITSMVSTVFGALFVNLKQNTPDPSNPPQLRAIDGGKGDESK